MVASPTTRHRPMLTSVTKTRWSPRPKSRNRTSKPARVSAPFSSVLIRTENSTCPTANGCFTTAGRFGFYGRTGGENENQWIDNLLIKAIQSSGPLTITAQPANATVLVGSNATFTVGLSDPNGATYVWSKNNSTISGATGSSYTTPATTLADNGATFKVVATGPSGTA